MDAATRVLVRSRAADRCEYCLSHQEDEPFFRYQIEHIIPKQHDGADDESNLALACPHCNAHKGPNLSGLDPIDQSLTPLFHPRQDRWDEHFEFRGSIFEGRTAVGRATIRVLKMNDRIRVEHRISVGNRGDE